MSDPTESTDRRQPDPTRESVITASGRRVEILRTPSLAAHVAAKFAKREDRARARYERGLA